MNEPITSFLKETKPLVQWFPSPSRGKCYADPFGICLDGRIFILCEEFDYRTYRGSIVSFELTDMATIFGPQVAIQTTAHCSYPYLLEQGGEIYCVPETSEARQVSLFKAERFPSKWVKIATLIRDFAGVDATVFQYDGRWWLTCTNDDEGVSSRLYVWYSKDLIGPWTPHSANPVKADPGSSRPAGTPFVYRDELIRPAQDCSRTYGGRVILNKIRTLTPSEFEEEPVSIVGPYLESPYPNGVHTLSSLGNLTLIDAKRSIFDRSAFGHTITEDLARFEAFLLRMSVKRC